MRWQPEFFQPVAGKFRVFVTLVLTAVVVCLTDHPCQAQVSGSEATLPYTLQTRGATVLQEDFRMIGTPIPLAQSTEVAARGHAVPGNGAAPEVRVLEPIRTLKVGESQILTFTFDDPENDPLFAGVVGFLPQIVQDGRFFSKTKIKPDRSQLGRTIDIEVLPSPAAGTIVWRLTALRPGTAVLLLVATELFASTDSGQFQLFAGNVSFEPVTLTVTDALTLPPVPALDTLPPDFVLRRGEALTWVTTSRAPSARPLTYGFGVLGFAGRIVEAKFTDNALRMKANEAGKAVMLGYVTDGISVEAFARPVTVLPTRPGKNPDATPPTPQIRAVSVNVFPGQTEPSPPKSEVLVFGELLSSAAQAVIISERGDQFVTAPFIRQSTTRGWFVWEPAAPGGYLMWLTDSTGKQITPTYPLRVVGVQVSGILRLKKKSDAPVIALLVRGQGLGKLPTVLLNGNPVQVKVKRSLQNRLNQRILVKLPVELQNQASCVVQIINEAGFTSDAFFVPLS